MKISVFGLGYVGCVSLACLADKGHAMIGIDLDDDKVQLINDGKSTIVEKKTDPMIYNGIKNNKIIATTNPNFAIKNTDIAFVCVGTPNLDNGLLDMSNIYRVAEMIGDELSKKKTFFTVIIRSTVMPGTYEKVSDIIAKKSNKKINIDFGLVLNPEFLREGTAVSDFFNPPYTIIGTDSKKSSKIIKKLFSFLDAPFFEVDKEVTELIKFLNNSYHALKVAFTNEVGRISKKLNVDSRHLMHLFVSDEILNISSKYFNPGFSYGGSCLPKDLSAFKAIAKNSNVKTPIIDSISRSNDIHDQYVYEKILNLKKNKIGIHGLSFKSGTDDLRFSPSLRLCENLVKSGLDIKIFDENVTLSMVKGKNKDFLFNNLPDIEKLIISDINDFIRDLDVIVIVHKYENTQDILKSLNDSIIIIDLAFNSKLINKKNYNGLLW